MEEPKTYIFDEIPNIESYRCVLGLNFPESATDFQKAYLTLAHLMASTRDFVLKGVDVPLDIIKVVLILAVIIDENGKKQR